jgi:glycosyltransferase involved in cell wall biosynthesis
MIHSPASTDLLVSASSALSHAAEPSKWVRPDNTPPTSLLIEGWRGLNHSYGLVNQYQILELLKIGGLQLFHHDLPFFNEQWNRMRNDASFPPDAQRQIDALPPAGDAHIDCVYRIASPVAAGADNDKRRTLTFMITELGFSRGSLAVEPNRYPFFTRDGNFIVTSTAWSRHRLAEFGFPAEKIRIVPLGVDTTIFRPLSADERVTNRANLGIHEDETVFVNVGGAFWNKGIDLLLRAFAELRIKGRQVRLIVKDQRSLYGVTIEQIVQSVAKDAPHLFGSKTMAAISVIGGNLRPAELRALYGIADCYVSPYRAEGFNLPVLEAIACGTPVIVTQGGATDDFCLDGVAYRIPGQPRTTEDLPSGLAGKYIEPDFDALVDTMDGFATGHRLEEGRFTEMRGHILEAFSWRRAAHALAKLAAGDVEVAEQGNKGHILMNQSSLPRQVFQAINSEQLWGHGSGPGSSPTDTTEYKAFVERFIEANSVRSITDFGCGDWQFPHLINWWQGEYLGLDVVPEIVDRNRRRFAVPNVRFEELTAIQDIPGGDLLISKEVLEHLPNQTIIDYLAVIRKKYRFAILTNAVAPTSANIDIVAGGWRPVRLQDAPLNTPGAVVFNYCSQAGNICFRNAVFLMLGDATESIARS